MKTASYTLTQEPESYVYHRLLDYALGRCSMAFFVVRPEIPLAAEAIKVLAELEPLVKKKVIASEWPGTRLIEGTAVVQYFDYNTKSADILRKYSTGLFQWVQPDLPEDLSLLTSVEDPWLVSIAHERDGYFLLGDMEVADLVTSIPELKAMIRKDDPLP